MNVALDQLLFGYGLPPAQPVNVRTRGSPLWDRKGHANYLIAQDYVLAHNALARIRHGLYAPTTNRVGEKQK